MNHRQSIRIQAFTLLCLSVFCGTIHVSHAEAQALTAYFPQVVVGGGYTTVFTLMNTGSTELTGRLSLTDLIGSNWNVVLSSASDHVALAPSNDPFAATNYTVVSLPPGGMGIVTASPVSPVDLARTGWARFESTGGTFGGVATFLYAPASNLQTTAGVLSTIPVEAATIPIDNDDSQQRYTGYAIANTSGANLSVKIVIVDQQGVAVQTLFLPQLSALYPSMQFVRFLHQDAPQRLNFKGSMVLIASPGQKFCVVALVQNQGLLTAIPVMPSKAPNIN